MEVVDSNSLFRDSHREDLVRGSLAWALAKCVVPMVVVALASILSRSAEQPRLVQEGNPVRIDRHSDRRSRRAVRDSRGPILVAVLGTANA